MRFSRRAEELGFTLSEVEAPLGPRADARRLTEAKIADLRGMRDALRGAGDD